MAINNEKQINPLNIIKGNISEEEMFYLRSRGLNRAEISYYKEDILTFIGYLLNKKNKVRILEIGFGEGRLLLELKKIFPSHSIELYGLNKQKEGGMYSRADLMENAKRFKISVAQDNLPKLFFYDADNGLKFESNSFDLVISQTTFIYIKNKARLIEEVYRVLKKNGYAYLQIDSTYRDFFKNRKYPNVCRKKSITPRFLIFRNKNLVSLKKIISKFRRLGFDVAVDTVNVGFNNMTLSFLRMKKNSKNKLQLGLILEKTRCLNDEKSDKSLIDDKNYLAWNGMVSIYHLK